MNGIQTRFRKKYWLRFVALAGATILNLTGTLSSHCDTATELPSDLTAGTEITLKLIMSDQDWLGRQPEGAFWGDLSESFYYTRKRHGAAISDLYRASATESDQVTRITPDHAAEESVSGGVWRYDPESQSYSEKAYIRKGDLYHRNLKDGRITQLTRTTTTESQPLFLIDGSIGFRRGNQFLIRDLETGLESEPFPLVFDKEPSEKKIDDAKKKSSQARQQERLFDIIKKKEKQKNLREAEQQLINREDPSLPGTPFYLGEDFDLGPATLSPSGRHLALVLLPKKRSKPSKTRMPEWVTASGDIETRDVRHKVGTGKPFQSKLMLLDRETRQLVEIKTDSLPQITVDPLQALRESAKKREEKRVKSLEKTAARPGDGDAKNSPKIDEKEDKPDPKPRPVQFRSLAFNPDGTALVIQAFSFDNKDRWLASVNLESGNCRPLHHLHDPAWINWRHNKYGWTHDGTKLWLQSEESGFCHLYLVSLPSTETSEADLPTPVALTQGEFVATEPQLSVDGRHLYFRANREHPGHYEIYRTTLTNGTIQQITQLGGMSSAVLSPNGRQLLITHSESTRPPELFIQPAEPFASAVRRTDTVSDAFKRRPWISPKHVAIPSRHGQEAIHSRLYLPSLPPEDRGNKRPAVMFIHGAGYLQNAHKGWSGYSREFMFHSFLAKRGFVVLDMDYRASAGYGRDWRTAIYRHM